MSEKKALLYICTALEAIEKIKIYSEGFPDFESLLQANDQMNFNAVCRLLLTIGEDVKRIPDELQNSQPSVDWISITGLRNRMAHDYRGIDPSIVFDIVRSELDGLKIALVSLLPHFALGGEELDFIIHSEHYKHIPFIADHILLRS